MGSPPKSNGDAFAHDAVDEAIAATDPKKGPTVEMTQHNLTIGSTGRPFMFLYPSDMSNEEVMEVAGWLLTGFIIAVLNPQRLKGPAARLWTPGKPQ